MIWLAGLFALVAFVYASVGFGGGSTYTALLALWGVDYRLIPVIALLCNIIVVKGGSIRFVRAGLVSWPQVMPLLLVSAPLAFLGGLVPLKQWIFLTILGGALLASAIALLLQPEKLSARILPKRLLLAISGGVGLLACCDIAIGVDTAKFTLSEVKLGLVPAVISPYVIAAIGTRHARRYFLSAEIFDAVQALHIGLLHEAVPAAQLDASIDRIVHWIGKAGPKAVAAAKQLIREYSPAGTALQMENQDKDNAELIARLRVSTEGQEGLSAFLEKRPSGWIEQ